MTPEETMQELFESIADDVSNEEPIVLEPIVEPAVKVTVQNDSLMSHETARLIRMGQVISKFASTLALRNITVDTQATHDDGVPAWSDSDGIWFNKNEMGDLTDPADVTALKGLSLHEIAHILLTPRTGSNLAKEVQRLNIWRAFNALEDQRIEMFMTKRFGNVADWLTACVAKHIAGKPEQHSVAFILTHGRKYLPRELRDQIRKMYERPQDVVELASLIDRYIVLNLNDPKNYSTAIAIIIRYDELVNGLTPPVNQQKWGVPSVPWDRVSDPSGHEHRKGGEWKSSKSKPMSKAEQEKLAQRVAGDVGNDGDPAEGLGQGGVPGLGDSDDSSNPGAGAGSGSNVLTDVAQAILDDVIKRKAKEIANTIRQYNGDIDLTSKKVAPPRRMTWPRNEIPSPSAVSAAKSFGNELMRLKADFDPGWNRRTDVGRLNVQQYMSGAELDECFDEWDNGRADAVDVECVILMDASGSMGELIKPTFESMWAIKRAMDKINASTTVVKFESEVELVYSANERATHVIRSGHAGGGTEVIGALAYAKSVLAESNRAIKICIAITDGYWYDNQKADEVLQQLRRAGVLTALAYIDTGYYKSDELTIDSHGCEVAVNITDPRDLFTLGRSLVKAGIQRNLLNG